MKRTSLSTLCPALSHFSSLVKLLGIVSLLGLLTLWVIVSPYQTVYTCQTDGTYYTEAFSETSLVGQAFIVEYGEISRVDVLLSTFGQHWDDPGALVFHLRKTPAAEDLITVPVKVALIKDNSFHEFAFDPLAVAVGEKLYFFLELLPTNENTAISVRGSNTNTYPDGEAFFDQIEGSGIQDLAFCITYNLSLAQRLEVFMVRLTTAKPYFGSDAKFYIGLSLVYSGLLAYMVWFMWKPNAFQE